MDELNLKVSASPHVRSNNSTSEIMFDVIIALVPATAFGVYQFGVHAAILVAVCIAAAVASEALFEFITKRKITVMDFSAVLTGLLLALNLPPELPLWMGALGSIFAIIVVKQLFGGIGQNFMNPALAARCFLLLSFSARMTSFVYDGVTMATPLAVLKSGGAVDIKDMFFGYTAGTIGETSVIALLIGAAYLLIRKVISPKIPLIYIGSFAAFMAIYAATKDMDVLRYVGAELCGGGLMLGAWFMATDYVTSPITSVGKVIYALLLGLLTFIFRAYGSSAEGVSYAIIISNLFVPLIEKVGKPKYFGYGAENAEPEEKNQKKGIAAVIISISVIALIMGAALGVAYNATKDTIAESDAKAKEEAYMAVYPDADTIQAAASLDYEAVNVAVKALGYGSNTIKELSFVMDADGNSVGYIVDVVNSDGYGGDIEMCVGVTNEGVIKGISFLSINETVGLGMEAEKPEFTDQFVGRNVSEFTVTKTGSAANNEIDALSGATITSSAVVDGVNSVLALINAVAGGSANE